jgi:hypothetical protein
VTGTAFIAHPVTGERLKAPRLGVQVRSQSRTFHDSEGDMPRSQKGGVIYQIEDRTDRETGEMVAVFHTVEAPRGVVRIDSVEVDDVDWSQYSGAVFPAVIRSVAKALQREQSEAGDPFRHMNILLALSVAERDR